MERFHLELLSNRQVARWFRFLHELETRTVVSATMLGEQVGISYRTVNSDMVKIRDHFGECMILDATNRGYRLTIKDREEYHLKKQDLLLHEPLPLILDRLLVVKELSFFDLVEELHFSESTLIRYLKRLGEVLHSFNIEVTVSPVSLKGNEVDIRNFYLFYFYESELTLETLRVPASITLFVSSFFQQFRGSMQTTFPFLKFCYVVYLSVERSQHDFHVTYDERLLEQVKQSDLFQQLVQFNHQSKPHYKPSWTEEELGYLCLSLLMNQELEAKPVLKLPEAANRQLVKNLGYTICEELFPEKMVKVEPYIEQFIESMAIKYCLSPTCLLVKGEVVRYARTTYPDIYHDVYLLAAEDETYAALFPEVDLAHVTAELTIRLSVIENSWINRTKKIGFLFEGNEEVCLNLKTLTKRYLGRYQELYFLTYQEVAALATLELDLLVTNCQEYKERYEDEREVLLFQSIPTASDWNSLLEKINPAILNHVILQ